MPQRRSGRQARDAWFASTVHRVSRCGRARGAQMPMARTCACGVFVVAVLGVSAPARAQADCFARVLASKNEQPHWMTPVVTVTPRLEQEFRYDTVWRHEARRSGSRRQSISTIVFRTTVNTIIAKACPWVKTTTPAAPLMSTGWAHCGGLRRRDCRTRHVGYATVNGARAAFPGHPLAAPRG